ncbi:MAG: hypothetical protein VKN60_03440 [Cyanobacteriota bacterium]|nr:hypothetical protein [Cyanobacteriota bacterium]
MFDLQTLIAILATLLLFITSVVLAYDKLQFRNYDLPIPQWLGLSLAGITFSTSTTLGSPLLVADQILRGLVRLEEKQRRVREENFRVEEAERQARRTRIETRYRIALVQFQLDPSAVHRRYLGNILALLQEYQDTL